MTFINRSWKARAQSRDLSEPAPLATYGDSDMIYCIPMLVEIQHPRRCQAASCRFATPLLGGLSWSPVHLWRYRPVNRAITNPQGVYP